MHIWSICLAFCKRVRDAVLTGGKKTATIVRIEFIHKVNQGSFEMSKREKRKRKLINVRPTATIKCKQT